LLPCTGTGSTKSLHPSGKAGRLFAFISDEYITTRGHGKRSNCSKSQDETHHRRIIQDKAYFDEKVAPYLNNDDIVYVGERRTGKTRRIAGEMRMLYSHPINFNEPFGLSVPKPCFAERR